MFRFYSFCFKNPKKFNDYINFIYLTRSICRMIPILVPGVDHFSNTCTFLLRQNLNSSLRSLLNPFLNKVEKKPNSKLHAFETWSTSRY